MNTLIIYLRFLIGIICLGLAFGVIALGAVAVYLGSALGMTVIDLLPAIVVMAGYGGLFLTVGVWALRLA